MSIEIITIGREILDGRVVDTNSAFFGQALAKIGRVPRHFQRVDDIEADMIDAFALAASRSQYVLVSGGLGPTSDDLTASVFAKFLGEPFIENSEAREMVRSAFAVMNRPILATQWKQAYLAASAVPMPNPYGTAPGFKCHAHGVQWFFVPGVPREMKPMFLGQVIPKIPTDPTFAQRMWMTHFTSEGELQQRLGPIIAALPAEISFSYRTRFPENHLGLSGSLNTPALRQAFTLAASAVESLLGEDIYSVDERVSLEQVVHQLAERAGCALMTVESCTGGLIASRLTDVVGASVSFWGGLTTYDNELKQWLAESVGMGARMHSALADHGAVSEQVASAMAQAGAQVFLKSHSQGRVLCVATTGIAGPDGGSAKHPVGTCYLAISDGFRVLSKYHVQARIGFERDQLKLLFSQHALDLLRKELLKS